MKNLVFLIAFIYANSIYSTNTCTPPTDFSFTFDSTTCMYTFTPTLPGGGPTINHVLWRFGSAGTYARNCDTIRIDSPATLSASVNYTFCFHGNQAVGFVIYFSDGSICSVDSIINVRCVGSLLCDPDPATASIPDPVVEITYVNPDTCGASRQQWHGCMFASGCGTGFNCISCGWLWAVRIPTSGYNCEYFNYKLVYITANGPASCDSTCTSLPLTPGQTYCFRARLGQTIYVIADGKHCCLPAGYERYFSWTPTPSGSGISGPSPSYGVCGAYRCPTVPNCTENQQTMSSVGPVSTPCFWGGGIKLQNRGYSILDENTEVEQNVTIYNIQGVQVFNGKWRFGDPNNFYLNWPSNIESGLYIIKFQDSQKLKKLFKFN